MHSTWTSLLTYYHSYQNNKHMTYNTNNRFNSYEPEPSGWKWSLVVLLIALAGSIVETKTISVLIILVLIYGIIGNIKGAKNKQLPRDR